jgi:DNA mismatch repair protein MutS
MAHGLAQLDCLTALAELASSRGYVRPEIVENDELSIVGGRHPVLESLLPSGRVVPNDVRFGAFQNTEEPRVALITGPNMAGKSTCIRQTALIVLLAQMGSFVPAESATIGIVDRLFTRVGASDELARGQSTFMVEMTETANILNNAGRRSLVVLDEIGRGTSTYDGISLAWAVVEHLHDKIGCRTLFATHYHELIDLEKSLVRLRNFNVAVREWNEDIVFLHQIVPGGADRSYGIHVARLAGVPADVLARAQSVLDALERDPFGERPNTTGNARPKKHRRQYFQLPLFGNPQPEDTESKTPKR